MTEILLRIAAALRIPYAIRRLDAKARRRGIYRAIYGEAMGFKKMKPAISGKWTFHARWKDEEQAPLEQPRSQGS